MFMANLVVKLKKIVQVIVISSLLVEDIALK